MPADSRRVGREAGKKERSGLSFIRPFIRPLSPSTPLTFLNAVRRFLRFVFYVLDAALLTLFLVGYLARYMHPRYAWWAEIVAVGLPYLSAGVVAAAALTALRRRWRLLALHAVCLALIVVRFGLPLPLRGEEARPGDLRVMTFNVPRWGGLAIADKTRRLEALTRAVRPDLVALQEANTVFDGRRNLSKRSPSYVRSLVDSLHYRVLRPDGGRRTPQPVLGRLPLDDPSQVALQVGTDEENLTYVVRMGFRWKGRRAVLYNVHLHSFGGKKPWEAEDPDPLNMSFWGPYFRQYRRDYRVRAREVEKIRAMLEEETLPVVVVGDFNSTPHSWAYRQLAAGMQDAFHRAGSGWGATYHARLPFARIDFVLASEEWEIVDAAVPDVRLSDHRPLLATLRWRSGEEEMGKEEEGG